MARSRAHSHEKKHKKIAERLGYNATVNHDEHGPASTTVDYGRRTPQPTHVMAIALAGRGRTGGRDHRRDDDAYRKALADVPWSQRGAAKREAARLSRKYGR